MTVSGARRAILEAIGGYDGVSLHNLLMKVPERETAHALGLLEERDRERILSILGPKKRVRVKEEIAYQKKLFVRKDRSDRIVQSFISRFKGGMKSGGVKSYIRPR
jgi:hypothetical protein